MLTPCRSKVTVVLALDPLQKQGVGHSLFSDSLQKQSHNLHLFSRLPVEARSPLFEFVDMLILCKCKITFVLALDPLQKQDLGLHLFFRLPAEAKSPLFEFVDMLIICKCKITFVLALDPLQKQGLGHSLLFDSLQKQSHNHHLLFTPRESKVTTTLRDPLQKQDLRISFWHVT